MIGEAQGSRQHVAGYCPMGCGETLVVGIVSKGILCQNPSCPDPRAIASIIGTPDVVHHIAHLGVDGFMLIHPLRERQAIEAHQPEGHFDCNLHRWLSECESAPKPPGTYIVEEIGPQHFVFRPKEGDNAPD